MRAVRTTLLVGPDAALLSAWAEALTAAGVDSIVGGALAGAIAHLREGGVDVVAAHAVDGTALAPLFEALERLPDAPPFVLLSGSPDGPELSARVGAAAFLPLPCDPAELVEEIGRITGDRRPSSSRPILPVASSAVFPVEIDDEPTGPGLRIPE